MKQGDLVRVWLPMCAGLLGLGYVFLYAPGSHGVVRWVGLAVGTIGLAGVVVARYTLGRSFSVKARATELITNGIYSRIRNPIYVSGMFFIVGLLLMWNQPYLWIALVVLIPMQIIRARREAQVLEAKFGDDYRAYRARTWF